MSKLEESIEKGACLFTQPPGPYHKRDIREFFRAFAEAVSAKASEVREFYCPSCEHCHQKGLDKEFGKPPCDHNGKHLGQHCPELKECLHQAFNIVDEVARVCALCHKYLGLMSHAREKPKECFTCGCREGSHPKYNCKEFNSPALPDEVMSEIHDIVGEAVRNKFNVNAAFPLQLRLDALCKLCLSLRKGD